MMGSVALAPDGTAFIQQTLPVGCVPATRVDAGGREKGLTASWGDLLSLLLLTGPSGPGLGLYF